MFIGFVILVCVTAVAILCAWRALDQRDEAQTSRDIWISHNGQLKTELFHVKQAHYATTRSYEKSVLDEGGLLRENARLITENTRLTRKRDEHGRYLKK